MDITPRMIEDYAKILGNSLGSNYNDLEYAELTLLDLERHGCTNLGTSCDECPYSACGDNTCPVKFNELYDDNANDELSIKIRERDQALQNNE